MSFWTPPPPTADELRRWIGATHLRLCVRHFGLSPSLSQPDNDN